MTIPRLIQLRRLLLGMLRLIEDELRERGVLTINSRDTLQR